MMLSYGEFLKFALTCIGRLKKLCEDHSLTPKADTTLFSTFVVLEAIILHIIRKPLTEVPDHHLQVGWAPTLYSTASGK